MTDIELSPVEVSEAIALLRAGLGEAMFVQASGGAPHGPAHMIVARRSARGARERGPQTSTKLRLVPYDPTHPRASRTRTVLVLHRASPALRDSLRTNGDNFIDLSGAVHLRLPWLLLDRNDIRNWRPVRVEQPSSIDPFGDRTSRVVRTILAEHLQGGEPRAWGVRELSAASGVDRTTVSRVMRRLEAWRILRVERRGRAVAASLRDATRLLDRWSASYDWTRSSALAVHAPIGDPQRFLSRLPLALGSRRWALTLQAGASLLAPLAAWDRVHLYVDVNEPQELASVARAAEWRPGVDGNVVLMRPFYRVSVWDDVQHVRALPVVHLVQLLVDLWQYPSRGREQAEHLLEVGYRVARDSTRKQAKRHG